MVRWLAAFVGLAVFACAGRSGPDDEQTGDAGEGSGGTSGSGSANGGDAGDPSGGFSGAAPNGGSSTGGESTGGESTGGESTGGESTGGATTGGSSNGGTGATSGSPSGGSAGTSGAGGRGGAAGASGAAGANGGASGACTTPNPAGCPQVPCAGDETCWMRQGDCRPGSCTCSDDGQWACTRDCGGGVCRPTSCPAECEPSEGTCGTDGVTWVCYIGGGVSADYQALIDGGCQDLATQIPRFCCPATFKPECRVED
jgi:hypothetical protein